ncbi:hypothetical protein WJX73_000268 [Symbiochloris irregularis]|uniref:DUF4042 domain-containing protein n=1 Tax=Symbiochloris irregularis TaxID=706552 RepID=A0AAW1PXI5_9CHLO
MSQPSRLSRSHLQDLARRATTLSKADLQPAVQNLALAVQQSTAAISPAAVEGGSTEDLALLLRTFQILLSQVQAHSDLGVDLSALLASLSLLWTTPALQPASEAPPSTSAQRPSPPGKYQPPRLRKQRSNSTGFGAPSDSESEVSDGDSARQDAASLAAAARLAAVQSMQDLARITGRALHAHWQELMEVHAPSSSSRSGSGSGSGSGDGSKCKCSLVAVMLEDPSAKVRAAAATALAIMLQGNVSKTYMRLAELNPRQPARAFKPLSTSLGELNVGLHKALIQGLEKEQTATALMSLLRSLSALMSATSYERLPSDLLPSALQAAHRCLLSATRLGDPSHKSEYLAATALACLGAGLSIQPQLLQLANSGSPLVATEAIATLRALVRSFPEVLAQSWPSLLDLASRLVAAMPSEPSNHSGIGRKPLQSGGDQEEKCTQQAVLLVADAVTSLHRLPQSSNEDDIIDESSRDSPDDSTVQQLREAAAAKWQQAVQEVHTQASSLASSVVRGAACTSLSLLDDRTFACMHRNQSQIVWAILSHRCSSTAEPTPAVRTAAARGIGTLAMGSSLLMQQGTNAVLSSLTSALKDPQASVTGAALWALANLAGTLRQNSGAVRQAKAMGLLSPLLKALLTVLREHKNYKIRTHAAAAVACLPSVEASEPLFGDCIDAVAESLASTRPGAHQDTPSTPSASNAEGHNSGRLDLKYLPHLRAQLRSSLVHLLCLANSEAAAIEGQKSCSAARRHSGIIQDSLSEQARQLAAPSSAGAGQATRSTAVSSGMERDDPQDVTDSFLKSGMTALMQSVNGAQNTCREAVLAAASGQLAPPMAWGSNYAPPRPGCLTYEQYANRANGLLDSMQHNLVVHNSKHAAHLSKQAQLLIDQIDELRWASGHMDTANHLRALREDMSEWCKEMSAPAEEKENELGQQIFNLSSAIVRLSEIKAQAVQMQAPWNRMPFMDFARQGRHFPFWQDPGRRFPMSVTDQHKDALNERFAQVSSKLTEIMDSMQEQLYLLGMYQGEASDQLDAYNGRMEELLAEEDDSYNAYMAALTGDPGRSTDPPSDSEDESEAGSAESVDDLTASLEQPYDIESCTNAPKSFEWTDEDLMQRLRGVLMGASMYGPQISSQRLARLLRCLANELDGTVAFGQGLTHGAGVEQPSQVLHSPGLDLPECVSVDDMPRVALDVQDPLESIPRSRILDHLQTAFSAAQAAAPPTASACLGLPSTFTPAALLASSTAEQKLADLAAQVKDIDRRLAEVEDAHSDPVLSYVSGRGANMWGTTAVAQGSAVSRDSADKASQSGVSIVEVPRSSFPQDKSSQASSGSSDAVRLVDLTSVFKSQASANNALPLPVVLRASTGSQHSAAPACSSIAVGPQSISQASGADAPRLPPTTSATQTAASSSLILSQPSLLPLSGVVTTLSSTHSSQQSQAGGLAINRAAPATVSQGTSTSELLFLAAVQSAAAPSFTFQWGASGQDVNPASASFMSAVSSAPSSLPAEVEIPYRPFINDAAPHSDESSSEGTESSDEADSPNSSFMSVHHGAVQAQAADQGDEGVPDLVPHLMFAGLPPQHNEAARVEDSYMTCSADPDFDEFWPSSFQAAANSPQIVPGADSSTVPQQISAALANPFTAAMMSTPLYLPPLTIPPASAAVSSTAADSRELTQRSAPPTSPFGPRGVMSSAYSAPLDETTSSALDLEHFPITVSHARIDDPVLMFQPCQPAAGRTVDLQTRLRELLAGSEDQAGEAEVAVIDRRASSTGDDFSLVSAGSEGARMVADIEEPLSSSPNSGNADAFMAHAGSSELLQSRRSFQEAATPASLPALSDAASSAGNILASGEGTSSQQAQFPGWGKLTDELETMMSKLSAVTTAGIGMPAISAAIPVPVPAFTDLPLISQGPTVGPQDPSAASSGIVPPLEMDDGHSDASWTDVDDLE